MPAAIRPPVIWQPLILRQTPSPKSSPKARLKPSRKRSRKTISLVTEEEQTLPEAEVELLAEDGEDLALLVVPEETVAPEPERSSPAGVWPPKGMNSFDDDVETPLRAISRSRAKHPMAVS